MTPSVPFAVLSDRIKRFDGLYHTYIHESFLAHLTRNYSTSTPTP